MNWFLLRNSLVVGVLSTGISVIFGLSAALWVCGLPSRLRALFFGTAIFALACPPFLVTNCWLHFLGRTGVWHRWLPLDLFSMPGTIWVLSMLLWPISFFLVWGAWQRLEQAQIESDPFLTGWALLRAVLFPLAHGALIQAALVTLVLALNEFSVPAILQVKVLPAEMWIRFNTTFNTWGALQLSWPLVLAPLLLLLWTRHRAVPWPHLQSPIPPRVLRTQLGSVVFWSCGLCTAFVIFSSTFMPLFQILSWQRTWTELLGAIAAGQTALWNSVVYPATAATLIVTLGLMYLCCAQAAIQGGPVRKSSSPGKTPTVRSSAVVPRASLLAFNLVSAGGWLAFFLPGVMLGIALIYVFNRGLTSAFYQSGGIVVLAFCIRYVAIGLFSFKLAERKLDRDLIDVARVEGATHWQLLRHVVWPQVSRHALATWYVVFLLCLWDVESMLLVVPPGGETLALRVFNLLHYGHNAQVNALCLVLLLVALTPLVLWQLGSLASRRIVASKGAQGPATPLRSCYAFVWLLPLLVLLTSCSPSAKNSPLSRFFERVEIIGSRGVGVGQLNKPRSVAVDTADNLYVIDMTGRVQKFSTNGSFMLSWQMPEIERGRPKGMCHDAHGNIFLVEPHYSRVNIFSPVGKLLAQWGSHGTNDGQLSLPRGVAVNSHEDIFVSEYEEAERIQRFRFDNPDWQANSNGLVAHPRWIGGFGSPGTGPGEFNRAEGVCVDSQDRLYVADSCNHRIQIFSSDGKFLRTYGRPGKGIGELSYPYDICVDKAGVQYVAEFGNSRIQVFDPQDRPIEIIGGPGAEPGRFSNPWGLALDSAGNLYVADSQNHRVQKLVRRK
jgi:ABC-type Fe3+ transport system permease subunit/sugar lactone lactonase YvrE